MAILSRRAALAAGTAAALLPAARAMAAPAPLADRVELIVGHAKSAHTCPMSMVPDMLRPLGVDIKFVEFIRYADSRTAVGSGSLDIATTAPGDILVLLSQGVTTVRAIVGMGSSKKFVIAKKAGDLPNWDALRGKRLGVPAGSAVWAQYAAAVTERNFPYDAPKNVNIQGGGPSFVQALQRGDVDAILLWQPFESMALIDKVGEFTTLEYGDSKGVGSELGMFCATTNALTKKREAVNRFFWAYLTAEKQLRADKAAYVAAIANYTGVTPTIAASIAENVTLGGVVDAAQLQRQARFFLDAGVLQKDVAAMVPGAWDNSPVRDAAVG